MGGRILQSQAVAIMTVVAVLVVLWYGFTVYLNAPWQIDSYEKAGQEWSFSDLVRDTMAQERPVLPAAHQVFAEIWATTIEKRITSKRSLVYHGWVTTSEPCIGWPLFQRQSLSDLFLAMVVTEAEILSYNKET